MKINNYNILYKYYNIMEVFKKYKDKHKKLNINFIFYYTL